jgi:hypothetical protein
MAKILEELKDLMNQDETADDVENPDVADDVLEEEEAGEDEAEDDAAAEEENSDEGDDPEQQPEQGEPEVDDGEDEEDIRIKKNEYYALRRKAQKAETQAKSDVTPEEYEKQLLEEALEEIKIKKAAREFQALEVDFVRSSGVKDYEDVTTSYRNSVYQSLRILNPRMPHDDLLDMTRKQILMKASEYYNQGLDPIAEMYFEARELGFKGEKKEPEKAEVAEQPKAKTDLKKIAQNKKRSAGMAGAPSSGMSAPPVNLTPKEFKNLTPEQKRAYLAGS